MPTVSGRGEARTTSGPSEIARVVAAQRATFDAGRLRPVRSRMLRLKALRRAILQHESEILDALAKDLGKSAFEAYGSEVGFVLTEIRHSLQHIRDWSRPVRTPTPFVHQPATSRIHPQPKGVVLIIGPWNYPFQLTLSPLVGALAAGNAVVIKPSEVAGATAAVVEQLITQAFGHEEVTVIQGAAAETRQLLEAPFDHIFFTGSIPVGRQVMQTAAKRLTPVTLELGGKSPCLVDHRCDLRVAARRITWGKFYNAGQTCVAPDYLLVHAKVKGALLDCLQQSVRDFFGENPQQCPDYPRIINRRHYDRLTNLLEGVTPVFGGDGVAAERYLAPTVVTGAGMEHPLMEEEIFGPILPVLTFEDCDEALALARQRPNPLAAYVFTRDPVFERRFVDELPFGGGCINNALIHLANPHLPFGGVGASGMGAYHGKDGFDTFSHRKAVIRSGWLDVPIKYPPYGRKLRLLRWLMR